MNIISAMNPKRRDGDYTMILMDVWFEEFDGPLPFAASPFDCERHGKELWIRAMAGEYGPVTVIPTNATPPRVIDHDS
jgi:hypothetical protein